MGEKGKKKSRILLIVCGLLLLAGAIIGIVMFRMQAGASAYNESIKTAEKYADSGEYELAVLTYENAIKDRPKEEEGYLGLADVYLKRGESSAAKVLLQRGYMHTNSSKIQYMLSGIKDGSLLIQKQRKRQCSHLAFFLLILHFFRSWKIMTIRTTAISSAHIRRS